MAQTKFTADITAAAFPLLSELANRTVLQPNPAEGQPPITHPQVIYCENVLPTESGYKSVTYKDIQPAPTVANLTFTNTFPVSNAAGDKALIGIAANSKIYIRTDASPLWVDVTPAGWGGGDLVTTGSANGIHYLYLYRFGCYRVGIGSASLILTALTGITAANINGMTSAVNYLILWDNTALYWSSTLDPLVFTPSIITGAGTSVPFDLRGTIVAVRPLGSGFCVYTTANAVLASFSNNIQFPWVFRNANNVSGISSHRQVNQSLGLGFHVALTSAGVTYVTPQGGELITPEVFDFLAMRDIEAYDYVTDTITDIDLVGIIPTVTAVAVIAARYVVISYGATTYTDALVYDLVLKRWGKFHILHTCIFTIDVDMESVALPYNEASEIGQTYAAASPQTYGGSAVSLSLPPRPGRLFGVLAADGSIKLAYLDMFSINDTAVLVLGKYQATRNAMLELQEIAVETIPANNTGFSITTAHTINGKDSLPATAPMLTEQGADVHIYKQRKVGKSHNIIFKGSFNLTTVEITAVIVGRR